MLQCLIASVMHARNAMHDLDMKIRVSENIASFLCRVG